MKIKVADDKTTSSFSDLQLLYIHKFLINGLKTNLGELETSKSTASTFRFRS